MISIPIGSYELSAHHSYVNDNDINLNKVLTSPEGIWAKENSVKIEISWAYDNVNYSTKYVVHGKVDDIKATEYYLRFFKC